MIGQPTARTRERLEASQTARKASPGLKLLARAGYVAHGILYVTIGALALLVATGTGDADGERIDSKGALRELHDQPFGKALLVVMAIGLVGHALWRFVEAAVDPEREAKGALGVLRRIGWGLGGFIHAALVVYAVGLISGTMLGGGDDGGQAARSWSARLMAFHPYGAWFVGTVGAVFLAIAAVQARVAYRAELDEQLDLSRLGERTRRLVVGVSRFGIAARAVVAALIGIGLGVAAFRADPSRVQDAAEALDALRHLPYGRLLLIAVAIGLAAFGGYELIEARYRRIRPI